MSLETRIGLNTRIALATCGAFLIPVIWWVVKAFGRIPDLYLPSIASVLDAAVAVEPSILYHAGATTIRLLVGFMAGFFLRLKLPGLHVSTASS